MTTTDTDALTERVARVIHDMRAVDKYPGDGHHPFNIAAAVLPIVAEEVRKAKAEAWREYAAALEAVPDYAPTEYDRGRVDQRYATVEELHVHATEYEAGDSDEHR